MKGELEEVKAACTLSDAVIWDTRSLPEYSGQLDRGNRHRGHIAGAVNLEWFDLMDRETHRLKSPSEIRLLLANQGITPDKAVFAY